MSTAFDIRNIRLPKLTRATVIIGSVVVILALVVGYVGWQLYQKLTTNTVVAYFPAANALYAGDKVQIMGLRVGAIDKIEPVGNKMKVTFHYENQYRVPANASAPGPGNQLPAPFINPGGSGGSGAAGGGSQN